MLFGNVLAATKTTQIKIFIHCLLSKQKLPLTHWGWVYIYMSIYIYIHWGRVTHISVNKLTIIGSDNGLSPVWRQAIIWTNDGLLSIGTLWTNFSENVIKIPTLSFKKMHLKISSGKRRPFCLSLNVLTTVTGSCTLECEMLGSCFVSINSLRPSDAYMHQ